MDTHQRLLASNTRLAETRYQLLRKCTGCVTIPAISTLFAGCNSSFCVPILLVSASHNKQQSIGIIVNLKRETWHTLKTSKSHEKPRARSSQQTVTFWAPNPVNQAGQSRCWGGFLAHIPWHRGDAKTTMVPKLQRASNCYGQVWSKTTELYLTISHYIWLYLAIVDYTTCKIARQKAVSTDAQASTSHLTPAVLGMSTTTQFQPNASRFILWSSSNGQFQRNPNQIYQYVSVHPMFLQCLS